MKVTITFNLDETWDEYKNMNPELIVEDMFDNWKCKDGVSIEDVNIKIKE